MTIYTASKVRHAQMWKSMRDNGIDIISTWIDEAGPGESMDMVDLATRCIKESSEADALLLYGEVDEILKGALLEVGSALASGKKVYCVGTFASYPRGLSYHPNWINCNSIEDALAMMNNDLKS